MGFRMGSGKFRQSFKIYEWLDMNKISIKSIASAIGITPSMVTSTIRGRKNNRRVLKKLISLGCPHDYLSLPIELRQGEAA